MYIVHIKLDNTETSINLNKSYVYIALHIVVLAAQSHIQDFETSRRVVVGEPDYCCIALAQLSTRREHSGDP